MIRLYDSATGEVREVRPRDPGRLAMYVCGPTVYDLPHLGHGRFALVWDVARRWFTFRGLVVDYVSNITDIDDKIIARAARESTSEHEVADTYEDEWWRALARLGVAAPTHAPHATHYVESMVTLIGELVARDVAYPTGDGIYFDVSRVPDYGLLAGQPLDSLRAGARVEANEAKRSALDFALWKAAKPGEPRWEAPFGEGRPGWHTECVVMSLDLLGEGFDLHCGGLDLKFPHHENERAQAEALGRPFARHWAHNGWVMVGEQKMSKSLGNFTTLTDLLARTDPRAYRLLVLRAHYRSPVEVTGATIADATRALERLDALARRFALPRLAGDSLVRDEVEWHGEAAALAAVVGAQLDEDLNTPVAVAALFEAVTRAHALADEGRDDEAGVLALAVAVLFGAMGLSLEDSREEIDAASADLVARRDAARAARDWSLADELRDQLGARGWLVEDGPDGTVVRRP